MRWGSLLAQILGYSKPPLEKYLDKPPDVPSSEHIVLSRNGDVDHGRVNQSLVLLDLVFHYAPKSLSYVSGIRLDASRELT